MGFHELLDYIIAGHSVYGLIDGGLQADGFLGRSDSVDHPGVLIQRLAGGHHLRAVPLVDVDHAHAHLNIRRIPLCLGKGVAQAKRLLVRLLRRSVVKYHQLGHRQIDQPLAVLVLLAPRQILFIEIARVLQHPQRHVRVVGGLLLVHVQLVGDHEGHIVVHAEIQYLPNRGNLNQARVRVAGIVYGVVQA